MDLYGPLRTTVDYYGGCLGIATDYYGLLIFYYGFSTFFPSQALLETDEDRETGGGFGAKRRTSNDGVPLLVMGSNGSKAV